MYEDHCEAIESGLVGCLCFFRHGRVDFAVLTAGIVGAIEEVVEGVEEFAASNIDFLEMGSAWVIVSLFGVRFEAWYRVRGLMMGWYGKRFGWLR